MPEHRWKQEGAFIGGRDNVPPSGLHAGRPHQRADCPRARVAREHSVTHDLNWLLKICITTVPFLAFLVQEHYLDSTNLAFVDLFIS